MNMQLMFITDTALSWTYALTVIVLGWFDKDTIIIVTLLFIFIITVKPVKEQVQETKDMEEEEKKEDVVEEVEEIVEEKGDVEADIDEGADCGMDEPFSSGTMGYSLCGK